MQDSITGPINWYVIGERSLTAVPQVDFNGVRVFTWNHKMHRYETAFRARNIRGVYPLEIGQEKGNPTFRYYELDDDGTTRTPHEYVMYGVVTRALTAAQEQPKSAPTKASPRKASARKTSR